MSSLLLTKSQGLQTNLRFEVHSSLQRYDSAQIKNQLINAVRKALLASFTLEVSAVVTAVITTAKLEPTGMASVVGFALGGLFVMPYKKRELGRQARKQIMGLQRQLEAILEQHLESELSRSSAVFTSVMRPYISRNETELELLNLTNNKMQQLRQEIDRIRSMIYSNFGQSILPYSDFAGSESVFREVSTL